MRALHFCLAVIFSSSVFAALPSPQNVKMDAINTRYILLWEWNQSQHDKVTFTAEFTFSNDESGYTRICTGMTQKWCNFSSKLDYFASYELRVRAEGHAGLKSSWAIRKEFCPEEDATLGPPTHVRVEPGNGMVTISFREPMTEQGAPMSFILKNMAFKLQYWDTQTPSQKVTKVIQATQHTLILQPRKQFCLQVSAISEEYEKVSPHTQMQCVTTTGDLTVWLILLAVVGPALSIGLVYIYRRKKRRVPSHSIKPSSILGLPKSLTPLSVDSSEESCAVMTVVTNGWPQDRGH
ncbi:interferon alpha/beta receptor 1a-like [Osmerus eperlanus]|uniref:interferon alpha/beta receptor 1a-like n=1 Tax=Osmerus eperlanus TaxID=29151 RepID=UPI002E1285E4